MIEGLLGDFPFILKLGVAENGDYTELCIAKDIDVGKGGQARRAKFPSSRTW